MHIDVKSALLGAGLVTLGYFLAKTDLGPTAAHAQGYVDRGLIMGGKPGLVTSSADGKTIFIWSLGGGQVADPIARPRIIKTVEGD